MLDFPTSVCGLLGEVIRLVNNEESLSSFI